MLDPTAENQPEQRPLCDRPATLQGLTVGLLDISKPRGNVFLDHLETLLSDQGAEVRRYVKPTFAKPLRLTCATKSPPVAMRLLKHSPIEVLVPRAVCTTSTILNGEASPGFLWPPPLLWTLRKPKPKRWVLR